MKDYQAPNQNPSLTVGYVGYVGFIPSKYTKTKNHIRTHKKQKQQKISYISYRTYREAQKRKTSPIIFQNSCMIQSESYTEKEKTFQIQ